MAAAHPDVPVDAGAEVALTVSPPRSPGGDPPAETTERAFAWADGEAHVFRGNGRFTNGIVCDFTLTLNRNGETLDGFFHWTVREVPPAAAATAPRGADHRRGGHRILGPARLQHPHGGRGGRDHHAPAESTAMDA
jgi:hypothetical protein